MTDDQVVNFVNGCKFIIFDTLLRLQHPDRTADYPAYELYSEVLRNGIFPGEKGKQLRLVVGKDRRVKEAQVL